MSYAAHPNRFAIDTESGAALPLAIIAMILIGHLAHRLTTNTTAYAKLVSAYLQGFKVQQHTRAALKTPSGTSRLCEEQTALSALAPPHTWIVCSLGTPGWISSQAFTLPVGRIDYGAIFTAATDCQYQRSPDQKNSFTSPEARYTCRLPEIVNGRIVTTDNIEATRVTINDTEAPTKIAVTLLATPGSIRATTEINIKTNTLIIAGGSISINAISHSSKEPIAVTVISAHGDLIINSVASGISLLAIGRKIVSTPITPPSTTFPLPPFIATGIAGIIPRDAD